jgi:hypothetical protein
VPMFEIEAEGAPEEIGARICRSLAAEGLTDSASARQ